MDNHKKMKLIGIWVCLLLALLLTQASGAGALQTPANGGQDAVVTPPPPPAREGDVDRAPQPSAGMAHPQMGSSVPDPENSPPGANPPAMSAPAEYLTPSQTAEACPINTSFSTIPAGSENIVGSWGINIDLGYPTLRTAGEAGLAASFALPGRYDSFSFEAYLRRTGCSDCANRLIIRGTPFPLGINSNWYESYHFQYTRLGSVSVYKGINGQESTPLQEWISSAAVNQDDAWNLLRVEANYTKLAFYINNTKIWEGTDTSLAYGRVGFGMYRYTSSTGDELRVSSTILCRSGNRSYLAGVLQP